MTEFEQIRSGIDSYCGLCCAECQFKESMGCGGCMATKGRPFHGECRLAQCAIGKGRGFCGECPEFPCQLLQDFSHDPEHGDKPAGARIENCAKVKAALVAAARQGEDPQGVCGHHCGYCPYTQWCGGCRSVYPHCSFAGLYEDGKCPNVACAGEKGIDGCYFCPKMDKCQKGYFSAGDGYNAKGAAMFIARHGKAAYADVLAKGAVRPEGIDTPEKLCAFWEEQL